MNNLPYVIVGVVCCIVPIVCLASGIAIGKYGLPIVWNPNWRNQQLAKTVRKPKMNALFDDASD